MQTSAQAAEKQTRIEHETIQPRLVYFRRSSSRGIPELCIAYNGKFRVLALNQDQFVTLMRDGNDAIYSNRPLLDELLIAD